MPSAFWPFLRSRPAQVERDLQSFFSLGAKRAEVYGIVPVFRTIPEIG
jgi:hypothetical protein